MEYILLVICEREYIVCKLIDKQILRKPTMTDYKYLYNKDYYGNELYVRHLKEKILDYQEIEGGYILPFKRLGDGRLGGGVLDSDKKFIAESGLHRGKGCAYTIDGSNIECLDEEVVFLGTWERVWGHCITDNLRRLWVFDDNAFMEKYKNYQFVYANFDNKEIGRNFSELLDIIGVDRKKMLQITKVSKFKKIVIPDECFWNEEDGTRYFTKEYQRIIGKVRKYGVDHMENLAYEKFYFSYAKAGRRKQFGEKKIERFFQNIGYKVIAPEEYSFKEQLNILMNCRYFASTIGSCSHNSVFLLDNTDVCLIPRANYLTGYQPALDQVNNLNVRYVDSSLSIFVDQSTPWGGPFYYYVSDELKECFGIEDDNRDSFSDFKFYKDVSFARNKNIGAPEYYSKIAYERIGDWMHQKMLYKLWQFKVKAEFKLLVHIRLIRCKSGRYSLSNGDGSKFKTYEKETSDEQ